MSLRSSVILWWVIDGKENCPNCQIRKALGINSIFFEAEIRSIEFGAQLTWKSLQKSHITIFSNNQTQPKVLSSYICEPKLTVECANYSWYACKTKSNLKKKIFQEAGIGNSHGLNTGHCRLNFHLHKTNKDKSNTCRLRLDNTEATRYILSLCTAAFLKVLRYSQKVTLTLLRARIIA